MASREARILILCKTYPSPSGKHVETSCVAGMEEGGKLVRLFPVPFRLITDDQKFRKWQWVRARIEKAPNDRRPESHKVFIDTITLDGDPLPTSRGWHLRKEQLKKLRVFEDFQTLQDARESEGTTLALLRPRQVLGVEITRSDRPDWTDEEREKLVQYEAQGVLFAPADRRRIRTLEKLPFDFHYRYAGPTREYRHKVVDWEAGALYWNCRRRYRENWEEPFREKLERDLPTADLMFLMGTIHRFPDQWLIVSLIYPPRPQQDEVGQTSLFDL